MKTLGYVIIVVIILIFFRIGCGDDSPKNETKEPKITLTAEQNDLLISLEADEYIKLKPTLNEVWVSPLFWATCKYDAKYNLGYLCAVKSQEVNGNDLYYCTIYDSYSGKKLGKYSKAWGFTIE